MTASINWRKIISAGSAVAATQTYVAAAAALADSSGYYFADCNPIMPDPRMPDEVQAAESWGASEQIAGGYLYGQS